MNILIDGMGGDNAPQAIVQGAVMAAKQIDDTIAIIGPEAEINRLLEAENYSGSNIKVVNATEVILNTEQPSLAVKKKKDSTIVVGMNMLKAGEGDLFISGGNTGALLASGLINLGRIRGIKRPAIAAFFPKIGQDDASLLLDCGANVETKPEHLLQYGIMGSIFVKEVKGIENPEVRLLNVGAEDEKGDELHKEAFQMLADSPLNFKGNVEARDVPFGVCDVVVTDGFSGNVFLKSAEGVAGAVFKQLKVAFTSTLSTKLAALLSKSKLSDLKKELDYSEEGGAPILGLKGPVLKIHGSSQAEAVYHAIRKGIVYVDNDVTGKISEAIATINAESPMQETD